MAKIPLWIKWLIALVGWLWALIQWLNLNPFPGPPSG